MGKDKILFNVGDMVFAKVRGYPFWPARISSVADPRPASLKYNVYFFGTAETASVLAKDICSYTENKDKLGKPVKRKHFKEGIEEIEKEIKKIENGEESTLGILPPEEDVETNKKNVRKSKKSDENQAESTEDDSQGSNSAPAPLSTPNQTPKPPKKRKRESDENEVEDEVTNKKKRATTKDKVEETPELATKSEQISRSGRVIKPKKFLYDEESEETEQKSKAKVITSPSSATSPQESKKDNVMKKPLSKTPDLNKSPTKKVPTNPDVGRLMWAKTKNGEMVQIKLDIDRPVQFKDDRSRLMWERATDINAKRLKAEIEAGEITQEDIKLQLKPTDEQKASLTEDQMHNMKKCRVLEKKKGKLRWLKLETRLVEIDVLIKTSLQKTKVDIDKALTLMDELINMPLDPLMLKKHPQVVDTTKKLRQYVGNLPEWNLTSEEKQIFEAKAYKIRQKANILFNKYTALFAVPENSNFWNVFLESVNEFAKLTENMPRERVYGLIIDPTSPYFKDVCQEETEEEEFKLKIKEAKEEALEKKSEIGNDLADTVKTDESIEHE